jgi:hypothetical protein
MRKGLFLFIVIAFPLLSKSQGTATCVLQNTEKDTKLKQKK